MTIQYMYQRLVEKNSFKKNALLVLTQVLSQLQYYYMRDKLVQSLSAIEKWTQLSYIIV